MEYKYCSNCGKAIKVNAKFCPHCGAKQRPIKLSKINTKNKVKQPRRTKGSNKHREKKLAKKQSKQKDSLYVKKYHINYNQIFYIILGLIVIFVLIFFGTKTYQRHEHTVAIKQSVTRLKNDSTDMPFIIGSGHFSDGDTHVNIEMSSNQYNLNSNQIIENNGNDNDPSASFSVSKDGVLLLNGLMDAIGDDNSLDHNANQMVQQSNSRAGIKGKIDMNSEDKNLVKRATKVKSTKDFTIFRAIKSSDNISPNQFILFERQ